MGLGRNLEPGQLQIGDFVFGEGTMFTLESMDIGAYEVNIQDYQIPTANEVRFGQDTLKPMPIQLTINALKNFTLENIKGLTGDTRELNFNDDRRPGMFAREWRADEVRGQWGEMKPLLYCRPVDGRTVRIYGRPGKLAVPPLRRKGQAQQIIAEYRRADTLCYSDSEYYLATRPNEIYRITRSEDWDMGNAPSWLRFLLIGPMKHPIIQLGDLVIELDIEMDLGEVVEVSSYPWSRRVIRLNDGISFNAQLTRPYLDRLNFQAESGIEFSWNATDTNASVEEELFSAYPNGAIPTGDWWVDHAVDGGGGTIAVSGGVIVPTDSGNQTHLATMVYKTPSVTLYQHVETQIANPPEYSIQVHEQAANRIIGRCNAERTEYLYWDIKYGYCQFGYRKNGVDTVLETWRLYRRKETLRLIWGSVIDDVFGIDFSPVEDWIYAADFGNGDGPLGSVLYMNGYEIARFDGNDIQVLRDTFTPYHMYTGEGFVWTPRFLGQSTPGGIRYHKMRDNPPPEIAENLNVSQVLMLWRDAWQTI